MSDLERDRAAHVSDARRCIQSGMQVTYTTVRGLLRALDQERAERDALLAKFEALADRWADDTGIEGYINLGEAEDALRAVIKEARA